MYIVDVGLGSKYVSGILIKETVKWRGVFRTLSNICDGVFLRKQILEKKTLSLVFDCFLNTLMKCFPYLSSPYLHLF